MIHSASKSGGQYRPSSRTSRVPTPMPAIDEIMCASENRMATVKGGHLLSMSTAASPVEAQVAEQAHHFLEQNIKAWMNPSLPQVNYEASISSPVMSGITQRALQEHNHSYQIHRRAPPCPSNPYSMITPTRLPVPSYRPQQCPLAQVQSHQASAAASFFARAAQKLNLSSRKKRRYHGSAELELDLPAFPTKFSDCLKMSLPPAPPALLRNVGRKDVSGLGKVKVMLRLSPVSSCNESSTSFLTVDSRKKQVTVFDPSSCGYVTPEERRAGVAAPKMFAFDAIFSQDDSQTEVCSSSLTEVIQAVVNGSDGCLFSYGPSKLGKTYTMLGSTESVQSLGVIPCAITWLYKLINEEKQKTGARFSVRVSAVEVAGRDEVLKDLLLEHANGTENSGTSPGIFLREDPIFGAQLQNQSELRVPNVEKAAYYLDAALAAASGSNDEEERNSHLLFTLHVYQYRVDKSGKGAVAGGRSRLHLLDLGSNERQGKGLSLSAIANVILAIFNGQKHVPYREFKLTQLLREVLGSISCRAAMIAHVTGSLPNYAETLATIQFASRIHRLRRKKLKYSGTSSGESSSEELKFRRHLREGGMRAGSSDPDCTSSSEQSCDTVIYVGHDGLPISDKELTDNEGPPSVPCFPFNQGNAVTTERRVPTPVMNSCDLQPIVGKTIVVTNAKKNLAVTADGKRGGKTVISTGRDVIRTSTPAKPNAVHKGHGKNSLIPVKTKTGSQPCSNGYVDLGPLQNHFLTSDSCQPWSSSAGLNQKAFTAGVGSSDEQWIDGPRISKAWLESRSGLPRREMWIDGPQAIYGWMDRHKRDMIQRWVELQSAQVQGLSSESGEVWIDDGVKYTLPNLADCMSTNLGWKDGGMKEYDLEKYRILDREQPELNTNNEDELTKSEDVCNNICSLNPPQAELLLADDFQPCASHHNVFEFVNSKSPCLSISDHSPEEPEINPDESMPEFCDEEEFVNDNFIETSDGVDCLMENPPAVSMQDSCLQVNEEDIIAACYEFYEEHPLRILSEENLASSFADSFSMSAEMENLSVLESTCDENCDHMDEMALKLETMSHFSVPACYSHLSISQTVSKEICRDDASTRSEPINLEPHQILTALRTNICWSGLGRWKETVTLSTRLQSEPLTTSHISKIDSSLKQQQYMNAEDVAKMEEDVYENRLRHPDGASNPDLDKLVEEPLCINTELLSSPCDKRSPGNGASYSDSEDKMCDEEYPQEDSTSALKPTHHNGENHLNTGKEGLDNLEKCKSLSGHRQKHSKLSRLFSSNKEHTKLLDNHGKSSPKLSSRIPVANSKHKTNPKSPLTQSHTENISINPQSSESNSPKKCTKSQVPGIKLPEVSKLNILATDHNCHKLQNKDKNVPHVDSCDSSSALSVGSCPRSSLNGLSITDNSSSLSSDATPPSLKLTRKNGPAHQISGTSSGYESMVRDSEGSGSSFSNVEVGTDSSDDEQAKSPKGADLKVIIKPCIVAFEIQQYSEEDIERLERRRLIEETLELRRHHRRVLHLRLKQDELRRDLAAAKERLMTNPRRWSYDLHVQDNMDVEDPGFLEVLEHETQILEKRVAACQSRVLMVTTFDAKPKALSPANIEA